ncbi:5'-nucleotidase, cytosolic IAa isoform X2 [Poecilia reticulata]|uniref:5'-nucleotidase, cytosolic IAa isoform X2 n=1 Tax=Poecilia reticulata TaxID=8081 RepID=UPI0007EB7484|nr:PREDICTED: cytosolic 5'-nucleotidase 1A-like isoform X2 [Poecilia reticulata]
MVKMSLDAVQVMSGQVKELKVSPSSNGDARGSWEGKEEFDPNQLELTAKPKPVTGRRARKVEGAVFFPKPENAVTVAVSSRVLFRTEREQKVFEQKGVEEYLRYQIEHENEPFAPGPAFPFVKALEAVNTRLRELYPQSEELFDIVLVTYNHAHVGIRLINTINHHNLFIERFCMTGGSSPIGYLKAWHTNLYLSADAEKVREALAEGIAAATMFMPEKLTEVSESQLRVAFDGDAVLFSDESERIFKTHGLDKFFEHEKENEDRLLDHVWSPEGFPGGSGEAAEEILCQRPTPGLSHPHVPGHGSQRGQLRDPGAEDAQGLGPRDRRGAVPRRRPQGSHAGEDPATHLLRRPDVSRGGSGGDGHRCRACSLWDCTEI